MGLQYDDAGFSYFLLASLSLYLLPSYLYVFRACASSLGEGAVDVAKGRTEKEREKLKRIKKDKKSESPLLTRAFLTNLTVTFLLTLFACNLVYSLAYDTSNVIMSFDPYEILSIDRSATTKDIKSAYRKKSLRYHPDKNPDNPTAQATFMLIAKAYEALTDETAKANWEKYGNPDGKQSLEISIGLPTFLLDPGWRNIILMTYLFCMVVLLPFCVWSYYSRSSLVGEQNIMYKTWSWFSHSLNPAAGMGQIPECLAGCAEFHEVIMPKDLDAEKAKMSLLQEKVKTKMSRPRYNHVLVVKGAMLVHAHLMRVDLDPEYSRQLLHILKNSGRMLSAMVATCRERQYLKQAVAVMKFEQMLVQAMWVGDDEVSSQLPHVTRNMVKTWKSVKGLRAFAEMGEGERENLPNFKNLTAAERSEVHAACSAIPLLKVEASTFVQDDTDNRIYAEDLVTVRCVCTRLDLSEGASAGDAYADRWPAEKPEGWWIMLSTREGKIVSVDRVKSAERRFKQDMKFMSPPVGSYEMLVSVVSDSYVGLDQNLPVKFEVLSPSLLPEYKVHAEDAALDDEPTLFDQMMAGNIEEDSDSEEEGKGSDSDDDDSDDEDDKKDEDSDEEEELELKKKK